MQPSACCCLCCWRPAAPPGPTTPPRRWGWRPCWRARCGRCCAGSARPSTACRRGGSGRCTAAWLRRTLCSCLCWGRGSPMCSSAISALSTKACPSCWPTAASPPTTIITSPAPTTSAWRCCWAGSTRWRRFLALRRGLRRAFTRASPSTARPLRRRWRCLAMRCGCLCGGRARRCSFWPAARRWPRCGCGRRIFIRTRSACRFWRWLLPPGRAGAAAGARAGPLCAARPYLRAARSRAACWCCWSRRCWALSLPRALRPGARAAGRLRRCCSASRCCRAVTRCSSGSSSTGPTGKAPPSPPSCGCATAATITATTARRMSTPAARCPRWTRAGRCCAPALRKTTPRAARRATPCFSCARPCAPGATACTARRNTPPRRSKPAGRPLLRCRASAGTCRWSIMRRAGSTCCWAWRRPGRCCAPAAPSSACSCRMWGCSASCCSSRSGRQRPATACTLPRCCCCAPPVRWRC